MVKKYFLIKHTPQVFLQDQLFQMGGKCIQNNWNSTNTNLIINVPIDENDTTLTNGELQIWAKIGANKWEKISQIIKINPEDLGKDKSITIKEIIVESINGFKDGSYLDIKSIIKDNAGNTTEGNPIENKIFIDQTSPIISRMTIESSNGYPSKAKVGDTISIRFLADEKIQNQLLLSMDKKQ